MDEYDRKLAQKEEALLKKKHETAHVVKQQLFEFKVNTVKKIKNDMLEGKIIKKQVEENQEQERRKELERKLKQAQTRQEFKKANEDLQAYKDQLKKREQQEENIIKEYARKKDQLEELRKAKEAQKFEEK